MASRSGFYWTLAVCLCLQGMSSGVLGEDDVRFTYDHGPTGPAHWGDLKSNWTACKTGKEQSPIRITPNIMFVDPALGELDVSSSKDKVPANISINEGYAIEVAVEKTAGVLKIDGVTYRPAQFHFHMGSEHKILGHRFAMELHQVYSSDDGRRAVIAWLFVKGADNKFLAQFEQHLPLQSTSPTEVMLPHHPSLHGGYHLDRHAVEFSHRFRAPDAAVQEGDAGCKCETLATKPWTPIPHERILMDLVKRSSRDVKIWVKTCN